MMASVFYHKVKKKAILAVYEVASLQNSCGGTIEGCTVASGDHLLLDFPSWPPTVGLRQLPSDNGGGAA